MKRLVSILTILLLVVALPVAVAGEEEKEAKADEKRGEVDAKANATLDELFGESPKAKELASKAHGYAVFGNWKFAFGISGGGGSGVAVNNGSSERTYMKMGTAGIGFGIGGNKYQVIFLFENAERFNGFIEKGWQADSTATSAAGNKAAQAGD